MMRTLRRWGLPLALLLAVLSCSRGGSKTYAYDPETERVARISRIDTLGLRTCLNPDSVAGAERLDELSAEAWILVDDATGFQISGKHADQRMFMASLTKMMTGLLVLEKGCLTDTIEITPDVYINKDSRVRLGETYVMGDLLYEMLMQSDNDAAYALAQHVGGDTLGFYAMMNEKAAYLGMNDTHFASPNGMPNDSNYSTARDLARLARYCMSDSAFATIVGTTEKAVPLVDGRHMDCLNTNHLLRTYEGCIGVKTGFTRQAGNCLASAARRDGVTLFLILLNSRSRSSRFKESAILLDYGFEVMKAYQNLR